MFVSSCKSSTFISIHHTFDRDFYKSCFHAEVFLGVIRSTSPRGAYGTGITHFPFIRPPSRAITPFDYNSASSSFT
jgi:hypothetical protein